MPDLVEARAPTRIDLAGGTIDIWPLYLLHEQPLTVNAAIDLSASARIERTVEDAIDIVSEDRGVSFRAAPAERLAADPGVAPAELQIAARLAAHFLMSGGVSGPAPTRGSCRITTACRAPAGSGLGGSSSLGIALACALNRFAGRHLGRDRLLHVTRAIETQVIGIPTGEQDYHPALHGGVLALHYTVEGTEIERLPVDPQALRARTVLVYSGLSRSSGVSNWDMLKRHLDGDPEVRAALQRVNRATHAVRAALKEGDWDGAGQALAEEWEARKRLSPAVTNPVIERLIGAAQEIGALSGKVCGAGGGGCLVLWVKEGRLEAIRARMTELGALPLDFAYSSSGVEVTES